MSPAWLSNAVPNPDFDLVSQCSVSCSGFSSLRPECEADPCLGGNLCYLLDSTIGTSNSECANCADWCCVSHSTASVFMILSLFCAVFMILLGLYYGYLFKKDERYAKEQAMSDAVDAASSGPSKVLQGARKRLEEFASSKGNKDEQSNATVE